MFYCFFFFSFIVIVVWNFYIRNIYKCIYNIVVQIMVLITNVSPIKCPRTYNIIVIILSKTTRRRNIVIDSEA